MNRIQDYLISNIILKVINFNKKSVNKLHIKFIRNSVKIKKSDSSCIIIPIVNLDKINLFLEKSQNVSKML